MPKKVHPPADLTYNEAHTALQLTLAALQANDLNVEELTDLYRQARTYLERLGRGDHEPHERRGHEPARPVDRVRRCRSRPGSAAARTR
jgi:hypothetical protein